MLQATPSSLETIRFVRDGCKRAFMANQHTIYDVLSELIKDLDPRERELFARFIEARVFSGAVMLARRNPEGARWLSELCTLREQRSLRELILEGFFF
jgi:hypothetical protein